MGVEFTPKAVIIMLLMSLAVQRLFFYQSYQKVHVPTMTSQSAEQSLVQLACKGDPNAIADLYRLYLPAMTRYISYRVADDAVVEDLTAEVFLRMMEGLPRYNPIGIPFEAWLYRIAGARVADYYRRQKRRPQQPLGDDLHDDLPTIANEDTPLDLSLQEKEEFHAMREALQQLSDEQQTILVLRFVERKSHEEVAELLGKSGRAVATAQHRALKRLAELLGTEKIGRHYLRGEEDHA